MKCEKCGNYEATCHYSYNINGRVAEYHLCSECAGEEHWSNDMFTTTSSMFESMFDGFGSFFGHPQRSLSPWGFGFGMPVLVMPRGALGTAERMERQAVPQAAPQPADTPSAADPEMSKRREINALREEMRAAVEAENFEKAAEIRDKIREIEK